MHSKLKAYSLCLAALLSVAWWLSPWSTCPLSAQEGEVPEPALIEGVPEALEQAGNNRPELERALAECPAEERRGMQFLVANMPLADLQSLTADFLLENSALAWRARRELPWGKNVPEEIFFNDVLPYANIDEQRDPWRKEMWELCFPIARSCGTAAEAAHRLNVEVFPKLNVKYSTQRKAPNQSPRESIEQGKASCTGLSIVLSDACRSVGIPARIVGTPRWSNKRGNHTWVEIWDGKWHFTGACEPDKEGLNRGWFVGDAAQAQRDSFEHAIYAARFAKSKQHFPLAWAMRNKSVPAENVTDRYARPAATKGGTVRLLVRVLDGDRKRISKPVTVAAVEPDGEEPLKGQSRGETADLNDILGFEVVGGREYLVSASGGELKVKATSDEKEQIVEIVLP